jgi:hypothetical protein
MIFNAIFQLAMLLTRNGHFGAALLARFLGHFAGHLHIICA